MCFLFNILIFNLRMVNSTRYNFIFKPKYKYNFNLYLKLNNQEKYSHFHNLLKHFNTEFLLKTNLTKLLF